MPTQRLLKKFEKTEANSVNGSPASKPAGGGCGSGCGCASRKGSANTASVVRATDVVAAQRGKADVVRLADAGVVGTGDLGGGGGGAAYSKFTAEQKRKMRAEPGNKAAHMTVAIRRTTQIFLFVALCRVLFPYYSEQSDALGRSEEPVHDDGLFEHAEEWYRCPQICGLCDRTGAVHSVADVMGRAYFLWLDLPAGNRD